MKLSLAFSLISLAGFGVAIASTLGLPHPAIAEPAGLQGSYVGVTVDSNQTSDLMQSMLDADAWGGMSAWSPADLWKEALTTGGPLGDKTSADPATASSQFQGRYDLPNSPLSARGSVFFVNKDVKAVMPMLSYDLPVANSTNVYAGAGYAFVKNPGTPLGDRDGVVLTTGVEAGVGDGLVIYGDAKLHLNRDRTDKESPVKLQVGAGYRF